jgi:hypothetical protein
VRSKKGLPGKQNGPFPCTKGVKEGSWFTKGFDTKDWQEAKALLDKLV